VAGYALSNFRIGFRADNGWEVSTWLRNAFDTHYFELLATQSGSTGMIVGQLGDPRTYGVTVRGRF
jgi:iron complex outermembrane receptor protein